MDESLTTGATFAAHSTQLCVCSFYRLPHVSTYRVPGSSIVWDNIDNDVVIINLITGRYFALNKAASQLWQLFQEQQVINLGAESSSEVIGFFTLAVEEGLAVSTDLQPDALTGLPSVEGSFEITTYRDLEEMLKLDPIHDVDPTAGWPTTK